MDYYRVPYFIPETKNNLRKIPNPVDKGNRDVHKKPKVNLKSQHLPLECNYYCVIDITKFTDIAENGWGIDFPNKTIKSKEEFLKIKKEFCTSQSFLSIQGLMTKAKLTS